MQIFEKQSAVSTQLKTTGTPGKNGIDRPVTGWSNGALAFIFNKRPYPGGVSKRCDSLPGGWNWIEARLGLGLRGPWVTQGSRRRHPGIDCQIGLYFQRKG
jgi:hypothetical protein